MEKTQNGTQENPEKPQNGTQEKPEKQGKERTVRSPNWGGRARFESRTSLFTGMGEFLYPAPNRG